MNKKLTSVLLLSLVIASILVMQAGQAPADIVVDDVLPTLGISIYAYFEGIDGEADDVPYEDWINVLSFDWEISQPETTPGPIRRRGDVVVGDIVLSKLVDKATPKLMEAVAMGRVIADVYIEAIRSYGTIIRYELVNVQVKSLQTSVGTMGNMFPTDVVTLTFEEIKVIYTEYDDQGNSQGNVEWEYSIEEGE